MTKVNPTSYFMAHGLITDTAIKDHIMNCKQEEHPKIYEAIKNHMEASEQYIKPFAQWVTDYDPDLYVIGPVDAGSYVKRKVKEDYYGD